mgnify:CR=1 FL=1
MPRNAKKMSNFFLAVPLSAIAPIKGANAATKIEAIEFPRPKYHVLSVTLSVVDQYSLKNTGKNQSM